MAALPQADAATRREAIRANLASRPEFGGTGISGDGSVWARFTDGRLLIVVPEREPSRCRPAMTRASTRAFSGLPRSTEVCLFNALGPAFTSTVGTLQEWLVGQGYHVTTGAGTIEQLKAVQGTGLLFMDTHSGEGVSASGTPVFTVCSGTMRTPELDAELSGALDAGHLAYVVALYDYLPDRTPEYRAYYGITRHFVLINFDLAEESLVYFNSCSSLDPDFVTACFTQGATVYAGWTKPVTDATANQAALFLFDRLLGQNVAQPESPKQRPFDWQPVWQDMQARGIDRGQSASDPNVTTVFQVQGAPEGSGFGILAPSVASLAVDEATDPATLTLDGVFGSVTGSVTLAGTPLTVADWSASTIRCQLPQGEPSSGDVVVLVGNRRSNPVPLTEWRGTLTFTFEEHPGPLFYQVGIDVRFRADVHSRRMVPHTAPVSPSGPAFAASRGSTASFSCGGAGQRPVIVLSSDDNPPPKLVSNTTWATNGSPNLVLGEPAGSRRAALSGTMDLQRLRLALTPAAFAGEGCRVVSQITGQAARSWVNDVAIDAFWVAMLTGDQPLELPLAADLTLPAGKLERSYPYESGGLARIDTYRLEWTAMAPLSPPQPDTPRRR